MITLGIVGSRRRNTPNDLILVREAITDIYENGDWFVSGGRPEGADRFAEIIAAEAQIHIIIHRADWKRLGKSAGFQRNILIAQDAQILIACVASDRTGGTEDTIRKFRKIHPQGGLILV